MSDTNTTGGAGDVLSANGCAPLLSGVLLVPLPAAVPLFLFGCALDPLLPASDVLDDAGEEALPPAEDLSEPEKAGLEGTEPPFDDDDPLPDLPLVSLDFDRDRFCKGCDEGERCKGQRRLSFIAPSRISRHWDSLEESISCHHASPFGENSFLGSPYDIDEFPPIVAFGTHLIKNSPLPF